MKILFLSRWFPFPPDNGSKIRVYNLIKNLATRHTVDLFSFSSFLENDQGIKEMGKYCRRVETVLFQETVPGKIKRILYLLSPTPLHIYNTRSMEMHRLAAQAVEDQTYDVVIASQLAMVPYARELPIRSKIFEEIELTVFLEKYSMEAHPLKRWRNWLTWFKATRYIARSLNVFDAGTVVSDIERKRVEQMYSGSSPICIIPNGVEIPEGVRSYGPPHPDTLVFSGSLTYGPNREAVSYFMKDIFPTVKAARPEVKLLVTGKLDGVQVEELPNKDWITFTGYLEDIRPTVATSWINIVPLRTGGGTRIKILESLALGTPVITTSKGAEGLELIPQQDILIADEPLVFANTILDVLGNCELREHYGQTGRRKVSQKYDWKVIGPTFLDFVEGVVKDGGKYDQFLGLS